MRRLSSALTSLAFAGALLIAAPLPARALGPDSAPSSFADLAEKLLPAVVNISSTQKITAQNDEGPDMPQFPPGSPFEEFFQQFMDRNSNGMPAVPVSSLGSGFVIDGDKGLIVTNNHVVKDAENVRVTFHDDSTMDAEIVGRDEKMDLAILKVKTDKKLPSVSFGPSDPVRVGDWVLAIGNPFGLGGTVTAGIVSARQRDIQAGPYDDFIQTDASINRGNSGGPMFNMKGEVIGINTAIYSPSGGSVGIGFAIPSDMAQPVIKQLVDFGRTRRGWLGVKIQQVTPEIAESLKLNKAHGALVANVTAGGPAEKAGLQAGDIILSFNGKDINEMRELPRAVANFTIGDKAQIGFWRDGKQKSVTVAVGELEKAEKDGLVAGEEQQDDEEDQKTTPDKAVAVDNVGLTVRAITSKDADDYRIGDDVSGVLVSKVDDNSEAAEKGILPGDVIIEVNQQPVNKPEDVAPLFTKARKDGRTSVLLLVHREGDVRFVALKLKDQKDQKDAPKK